MPPTQTRKSSRTILENGQDGAFIFPNQHHLVITTDVHVLSYDKTGLRNIFTSGSNGILAAKEARDGSATLAVADSQVVVLHRIEDGMERSYRLKGTEGQIRQLEFTPDSKTLFFTTTLLNAVQSYSLAEARLLEPGPTHSSTPTVIAISSLSHLVLTASESPPLIYLQNRSMGTQPILLQPLASSAPVVLANFHPDRSNIFLLAFKDGTVATYDATQISRSNEKGSGHPKVLGGEVGTFHSLHNVTTRGAADPGDYFSSATLGGLDSGTETLAPGARSMGVTGAAWVPGFHSRAITCGADGKCRMVDFDKRAIVRTWHVKGPASTLSILPSKTGKKPLIAVGRLDGRVAIFDTSGLLLREFAVDAPGGVIDIEWIKGSGPIIMGDTSQVKMNKETWIELYTVGRDLRSRESRSSTQDSRSKYSDIDFITGGDGSVGTEAIEQHGVEQSGTVFHRPTQRPISEEAPKLSAYMDLFSPVKSRQSPPKRTRSTPRQRPRLSSSTFKNSIAVVDKPLPPRPTPGQEQRSSSPRIRPKPGTRFSRSPNSSSSSANSKILADIRRVGDSGGSKATPGNFSIFAPYMPPPQEMKKRKFPTNRRTSRSRRLSILKLSPKKSQADSAAEVKSLVDDNIWLTADSEDETEGAATHIRKRFTGKKATRKLVWPSERKQTQEKELESPINTSHQLKMTEPVSRTGPKASMTSGSADLMKLASIMRHPATFAPVEHEVSPLSEIPSTISTEASTSFQTSYDTRDEIVLQTSPLLPGFAQSFQGPVKVDRYLPRKGSLAFANSPPGSPKRRPALGETSGNEQNSRIRGSQNETDCQGCAGMKCELEVLREEVAELRRLVKGKGKVES